MRLLLAFLLLQITASGAPPDRNETTLLLDGDYTVEVSVKFHSALLHFLDSLASVNPPVGTAGKTVHAHREAFNRTYGRPSAEATRMLQGFRDARLAYTRTHLDDRTDYRWCG